MLELPRPDGIQPKHIHDARGSRLRRWPVGLVGLGILLALSFFGVFGAGARIVATGDKVKLILDSPSHIRNGMFFETVITIETERDLRDAVILVDKELWREVTVNTILPEPTEHGFRDGAFEFRYGPLSADERLVVKVALQINSGHRPSANEGSVALADGDAILTTLNYAMEVLP